MKEKPARRHHHVCQAYLRGWATNDKIWVRQDASIRQAHTRDVAVQRDFYKLRPLSDEDIQAIKVLIANSPARSRRVHENYLSMFGMLPTIRHNMSEEFVKANAEEVAKMDETILTTEEQFHAGWESRAAPIIKMLRDGDDSAFSDDKRVMVLSHFIALQHFRTSAIKERCISRVQDRMGADMTARWNIVSHIFASNVGCTFYLNRKRNPFRLIVNETGVPFITSDQPTVNLLGDSAGDEAPKHLALFYPISPIHAIFLDDDEYPCGLTNSAMNEEKAHWLNGFALRASKRQIIAASRDTLEGLADLPAEAIAQSSY